VLTYLSVHVGVVPLLVLLMMLDAMTMMTTATNYY